MSTPKITFHLPQPGDATGDGVITQDVSSAPGKEREREPIYGGELSNMGDGMAVDAPSAGTSLPP